VLGRSTRAVNLCAILQSLVGLEPWTAAGCWQVPRISTAMFVGAPTDGSPPNNTLDAGTVQLAWLTHAAATTETNVLLLHAPVLKPVSQPPACDPYDDDDSAEKRPPSQRSVRLAQSRSIAAARAHPHGPAHTAGDAHGEANGHIVARARERRDVPKRSDRVIVFSFFNFGKKRRTMSPQNLSLCTFESHTRRPPASVSKAFSHAPGRVVPIRAPPACLLTHLLPTAGSPTPKMRPLDSCFSPPPPSRRIQSPQCIIVSPFIRPAMWAVGSARKAGSCELPECPDPDDPNQHSSPLPFHLSHSGHSSCRQNDDVDAGTGPIQRLLRPVCLPAPLRSGRHHHGADVLVLHLDGRDRLLLPGSGPLLDRHRRPDAECIAVWGDGVPLPHHRQHQLRVPDQFPRRLRPHPEEDLHQREVGHGEVRRVARIQHHEQHHRGLLQQGRDVRTLQWDSHRPAD
jgi:hypothetical protein